MCIPARINKDYPYLLSNALFYLLVVFVVAVAALKVTPFHWPGEGLEVIYFKIKTNKFAWISCIPDSNNKIFIPPFFSVTFFKKNLHRPFPHNGTNLPWQPFSFYCIPKVLFSSCTLTPSLRITGCKMMYRGWDQVDTYWIF